MNELTFELVCKQLKKDKKYGDIVEKINVLSGAAIVLLGVRGVNGDVSAFVNALSIKDELINIAKCIIEKMIENKTNKYDERLDLIQWSYTMIYYTSFFDILDEKLPEDIRESLQLKVKEKKHLFSESVLSAQQKVCISNEIDEHVFFPNIYCKYSEIENRLSKLYYIMSEGLRQFVDMLSFKDNNEEKIVGEFEAIIKDIPKYALNRFKSQYLYLASHFNEFYIYVQMIEIQETDKKLEQIYKKLVSIGESRDDKIDIGLQEVRSFLINLPEIIEEENVNKIVHSLLERYQGEIENPIIDSKIDDEKLKYPSIKEAFIPQSYKIINYSGKEQLENKKTWETCDIFHDMDSFWAQYLYHPDSFKNLLLILGEPGGGKSLLTKILSARIITNDNVIIRIPLRDINADNDIEVLICEQLQKDGDATDKIPTFKWFAEHFKKNPITIIFDGYDEVLQATGGIYKTFLKKILKFQLVCEERHRPIRVIVTSRETLIDKAELPVGTIVMKLLEFSNLQRKRWIEVWNEHNKDVFELEKIKPFNLPTDNSSIEELSRQPLLLLMLAIYDANIEEGINTLGQNSVISRTTLYNELLCRFIRRELKKGPRGKEVKYEELDLNEQEALINCELERLGIAAFGMYVRGKLSLQVLELEKDLITMEVDLPKYENCRKLLSQAEILFGSFFFIHDSQSGIVKEDNTNIAFEFLHKTFYEFLVADLILKYLIKEIEGLNDLRMGRNINNYHKALNDPNHLGRQFYLTLIYTHLCAEPEILEMIVEWKAILLKNEFENKQEEFENTLCELFQKQVEVITNDLLLPDIWKENNNYFNEKKSYLQYCAMFLMNLLILQVSTNRSGECSLQIDEWKYLSIFWKMNIDEEILLKFTALFYVNQNNGRILVKKKEIGCKVENKAKLEQTIELSNFIQDNVKYNLAKLHLMDLKNHEKKQCYELLSQNGIDLKFERHGLELFQNTMSIENKKFNILKYIEDCCNEFFCQKVDEKLFTEWILYLTFLTDEMYEKRGQRYVGKQDRRTYRNISELLSIAFNQYYRNTQIIILVWKLVDKLGGVQNKVYIYDMFKYMSRCKPDIYLIILKLTKLSNYAIRSLEFKDIVIEYCENNLNEYPLEILKIFNIINLYKPHVFLDIILNIIKDKLEEFLHEEPYIILQLIKSLNIEKYSFFIEKVYGLFTADFNYFFRRFPDISVELIKYFVKLNLHVDEIYSSNRPAIDHMYISGKSPKASIGMLELMILFDDKKGIRELKQNIMRRYDEFLHEHIESALNYLITIYTNGLQDEESTDILIRYFGSILVNYDTVSIYDISILLDSLDLYSFNKFSAYWRENNLLFEINCPGIAKVINKFYEDIRLGIK
ncbi:MAG: hypothetical protein E7249_16995 [Paenibacillaceae bacterium]|nr:hypothetical protein [Paenibacillaceae bacterium]